MAGTSRRGRTRGRAGAARVAGIVAVAVMALAGATGALAGQSACGASYRVRTGDSLLEIAERCGVTLPALLAANPGVKDTQDMEVGDVLRVPSPADPQPSPVDACGVTYTIRTGDTLAEIAEKCGLTVPLLVAANGPLPDPLGVHAGERIRIPDLPAAAVADTATVTAGSARPGGVEAGGEAATTETLIRVEGVLEEAGGCTRVRAADGAVYGLTGRTGPIFHAGDRVVVLGVPAGARDAAPCGDHPVLQVRILYRGR